MMKVIRMSKKYSKHKPMTLQKYLKRKDVRNDATTHNIISRKDVSLMSWRPLPGMKEEAGK